ncbi:MAG: sigma-70 family RNA polymerase sigma factor [Bacteroidetes bacterium]|nr:sigma-70 family RNA polymerase sigma factor [Bacteroidota bacterium]MCL2302963.1 sigma-70 family RNA polymerase sigma factor [Lentimicrobiaceae bacterium]
MPFELIIAQCKKLQPQAQMAFYGMFYEQVFQRSYALLKDAEHAEEIMQDTMLKILQNIGSFRGDKNSMQKLLNKIAINQSIDALRKKKNIVFIEDEAFPEIIEEEQDIENDEKLIETALQHLNTLPDGYRMVMTLRIFEEMPFDEIGKKLNITASTARSQYVRGVQKLRDEIGGVW